MKKTLSNNQAHSSKLKAQNSTRGFTMVELVIAIGLLTTIIFTASSTFVAFFESVKTIRAQNLVYEEARFLMERMAREIRGGTIDYEEYYNQLKYTTSPLDPLAEDEVHHYGGNIQDSYCKYGQQFFDDGPDDILGTDDDQITGKLRDINETPITGIQNKLYLVNGEGTERTYFRRADFENSLTSDPSDEVGKVVILKMIGRDYGKDHIQATSLGCDPDVGEGDGFIDTWECESGFNCPVSNHPCTPPQFGSDNVQKDIIFHTDPTQSAFVDITPETLDIVDLQFKITPVNDPRKAFADIDAYQVQPHVTIKMIARANERISNEIVSKRPKISLVTTISARVNQEIRTVCLP